jgi:hypothetical protein
MRTPTPEVEYVHKVGQVVFLVAYVEGMLIHDLPRFQIQKSAPPELDLLKVTGMTTRNLGEYIAAHAPKCTDPVVAAYLLAGGRALVEIAPQRNGMLHARPAEDGDDPNHPLRLLRWRVEGARPEDSEVFMISHDWLDRLIERIDDIVGELSEIRPPFGRSN